MYVSLFGLSGIDQVKRKLIESVAPGAEAHPKIWETAKLAVSSGIKVLEGFHKGFAALSDLNLRPEDLDELLTRAAERGAERALACLGLENGHAARDIRDLRGLIDAWREARRTVWQTTVKVLTTGVLAALLVGIAIKLRLMGGPQ